MTSIRKKLGIVATTLIACIIVPGIILHYYPYMSSRICWNDFSWTSNQDFMLSLFKQEYPESTGPIAIEREATGFLRAGNENSWVRVAYIAFNHPANLSYGDTYPGLIYLMETSPIAGRASFFNNCGEFQGALQ